MIPLLLLTLTPAADPPAWEKDESAHLANVKQLTSDFVRAGEGYFAPDGSKIIYQAEEKETGNPFYQIFVQDLKTGKYHRVSPGLGKTTCSYFRPDGKKVIFASSHSDPDAKAKQAEEYKRREEERAKGTRRRYAWDFDRHMKIYEADPDGGSLKCLTPDSTVYAAEGSYSPDGKQIVYASGAERNVELFIMNADGSNPRQLTKAPNCYNGGPFFSPDGTKVIFRSDRKEKDRLQLYVINADGTGEKALTDNDKWVYWAPYWYKDGKHIIYTAADHSDEKARPNYDLYWMRIDGFFDDAKGGENKNLGRRPVSGGEPFSALSAHPGPILFPFSSTSGEKGKAQPKPVRITFAPGADVLPVFSPDGKRVMWTSNRDGRSPTQLYIADFTSPKDED